MTQPTDDVSALARLREKLAGLDGDVENATGIVASASLARFVADEGTVEWVARIIDPDEWLAIDRQQTSSKGRIITPTRAIKERYCKRSLAKARAILSLIASAGEQP